jgi:hypothetical protein
MIQHRVCRLQGNGELTQEKVGYFSDFEPAMNLRDRMGGSWVVHTETHPGYEVIRSDRRGYGLILTCNAGTATQHYLAMYYLDNKADWDGDTYCSSRTYKTYKGAGKKVRQYLGIGE